MTYPVKCPDCGNKFPIHGYERLADCNECGRTFNALENGIHELESPMEKYE